MTKDRPGKAQETGMARGAPGRKPIFRREDVIQAALELMDRDGHEALSMRAIAVELATGVATLYNYFGSLAELNDALAMTLLGGIPLLDAKTPRQAHEQIKEMVIAYAKVGERHPNIDQMIGPHTYRRVLELLDSALRAMVSAGVDIERAGIVWSVLQSIAQSHAISRRRFDSVRQADMHERVKGLDAVMALIETDYQEASGDARFSQILDLILDRIVPELKARTAGAGEAANQ